MRAKTDVWQGTLALMVLKTLNAMGPQHGYGIARRIEQTSGELLSINHGTLYPVLLKLEQEGAIASEWGVSENNRRAKFYRITKTGKKQLAAELDDWAQATEIVARFVALKGNEGELPGPARPAAPGCSLLRPPLRFACHPEESGIRHRRGAIPRRRHWRQHRDILSRRRSAVAAAHSQAMWYSFSRYCSVRRLIPSCLAALVRFP